MTVMLNFKRDLYILFFIFSFIPFSSSSEHVFTDVIPIWLTPGLLTDGYPESDLTIYCHKGINKSIAYTWSSIYMELKRAPMQYSLFGGENATEVHQQYTDHISTWFPVLPWRHSTVVFPAFSQYCIGISTSETYKILLTIRIINYWKVLQTVIGVILFFSASSLSRNVFFHYTTGISLGVLASLLILIYCISKLIPKKSGAYSVFLLGSSLVIYCFQLLWHNLQNVVQQYSTVLLAYISLSALISFIVCYRYGPVTNMKTLNLIQWAMQLTALILIFFSSEYRELSTAVVIVILTISAIPASWIAKSKSLWFYYFPPKIKLLTEEEYFEQGYRETRASLEKLRSYCSSPECNAWSTISKLRNPLRFAKFVEGESHLTDQEILEYDSDSVYPNTLPELTDDESDENEPNGHRNHFNFYSNR